MSVSKYIYYLRRIEKDESSGAYVPADDVEMSIEERPDKPKDRQFFGIRYKSCEGIDTIGEAKNVYSESYAESDGLRVYIPDGDSIANEATEITLTLIFFGSAAQRMNNINTFNEYIRKGVHRYRDTARNKTFDFFVKKQIEPSEEKLYGRTPYVEMKYILQNINGKTKIHG